MRGTLVGLLFVLSSGVVAAQDSVSWSFDKRLSDVERRLAAVENALAVSAKAPAAPGPGDRVYLMVGASVSIVDPKVTDLSGGPRGAFCLVKDGAGPSGKDYFLDRSAYPGKTWLNGVLANSMEEIITWVNSRQTVYASEKDGGWAFTSDGTLTAYAAARHRANGR